MKKFKLLKAAFLILLVLALSLGQTSTALAGIATPKTICEENGGIWIGIISFNPSSRHVLARPAPLLGFSDTGTCTYSSGNAVAVATCGENYTLTRTYTSGSLDSETCTAAFTIPPISPFIYGRCGDKQEGEATDPVTLTPCFGSGGSATFDTGSCAGYCTVSGILPRGAFRHLPSDAISTLYVMTRDEDGKPSSDSYSACFDNPDGQSLTLYRFVSGAWRALVTSSADPICADASGDGAFYIGPAS